MIVPEIAYRYIYPKDVAGPTFEVFSREVIVADTSTGVSIAITGISKDKILVLSNVILVATPGATQAVGTMNIQGLAGSGSPFDIQHRVTVGTADLVETMEWQGQVFIPGRGEGDTNFTLTVTYDAGVASNSFFGGIHGVVIPRGNAAVF